MLDVYWGELLASPIPLELSLNSCSHACSYCFANLNRGKYEESPDKTLRLLKTYGERTTLVARLLQEGYPVVVSNRMDPFSHSNRRQIVPMLEIMTALGIPVEIQTKGGQGVDDVLSFLPPSTWYISLAIFDDAIRARVEPGAPSIADRLALIEKLLLKGHTVIWGLNPVVPEWTENAEPTFRYLSGLGIRATWIECLHLNYRQVDRMTPRQKTALGETIITRGKKRNPPPELWERLNELYSLCDAYGMAYYSMGQPFPTTFHAEMRKPYSKTFPVSQDFVNLCYNTHSDGDLIYAQEYVDALMAYDLPRYRSKMHHYIGATTHNIWWTHKLPVDMTYGDLFRIIWAEPRIAECPARIPCFAYAMKDGERLLDDKGLPVMMFSSEWFTENEVEIQD